jgi:hypothetical protein
MLFLGWKYGARRVGNEHSRDHYSCGGFRIGLRAMAETQMKTAEEVANAMWNRISGDMKFRGIGTPERDRHWRDWLGQALTAFAEERVKEYMISLEKGDEIIIKVCAKARAEALEDAANICIKNAEGLGCADEFYTDPDHDKVALAKAMLKAAALEIMTKVAAK